MKECKILGYSKYKDKNSNEDMLRVVVGIPSNREKYIGNLPINVFLKQTEDLLDLLNNAIRNNTEVCYQTKENIISGKTKITNFIDKNINKKSFSIF